MEDYHVFSSENLTDWTDHGVILNQKQVPWGNPTGYSMWAPDCIEKDGKYYFFFPNKKAASTSTTTAPKKPGVTTATTPSGPQVKK